MRDPLFRFGSLTRPAATLSRRERARAIVFILLCGALILLAIRLWPRPPLSSLVPLSTAVWSADDELLRVTLAEDDQYRLWTPLKDMSPDLVQAFVLKEDRWFRWHAGVNPVALIRAGWKTYTGGQRQGGSTLTMQLARRLHRLNTRTLSGKSRKWKRNSTSSMSRAASFLTAIAPAGSSGSTSP